MVQKILLIYNPFSGSLIDWNPDEVEHYFQSAFKKHPELTPNFLTFDEKNRKRIPAAVKDCKPEAVWVAGGDGTITSVAQALLKFNIPLGVLPGGTMNLLARDLGMNLDLNRAIEQLKSAQSVPMDLAMINGRLFLNICNIDISTQFTDMREKLRHQSRWIRWPRLAWYMTRSVFVYPAMTIDLRVDGQQHRIKTRSVTVSNNPLSEKSQVLPARRVLNQGLLGIYAAKERSIWSLPVLMLKLLLGGWHYDEDLLNFSTSSAIIVKRRMRRMKVMIDGELFKIKGPLNFSIRPSAISVLKPRGFK